jgi:excisionase family DNA binding protein
MMALTHCDERDMTGGGLMKVREVAAFLSVGECAVESLIRSGELPVVKLGERLRRVPRAAVIEYANRLLASALGN